MKMFIAIVLIAANQFQIEASAETKKQKRHHEAHVHGAGELNIVMENNDGEIEFHIPSESMVGFEHKPKSKQEKEKINEVKKTFESVSALFEFPKDAACEIKLKDQIFTFEDKQGTTHGAEEGHEEHAEFKATFNLHCKNQDKLESINVIFAKKFKGVHEITATWANGNNQIQKILNSKNWIIYATSK